MKSIIHWFAGNHVAANLLMIFIVVLGLKSWDEVGREVIPELELKGAMVELEYMGASAQDVDVSLARLLGERMYSLEGLDSVDTFSVMGKCVVVLKSKTGVDDAKFLGDVKARVNAIKNMPKGVSEVKVKDLRILGSVMNVALVGEGASAEALQDMASKVLDDLRDGIVSDANLVTDRDRQIELAISHERLRELGLDMKEAALATRISAMDSPMGTLRSGGRLMVIRAAGRKRDAWEFKSLPVALRESGRTVRLGDIANIEESFMGGRQRVLFNGKSSHLIEVYASDADNILETSENVHEYIREKNAYLADKGMRLEVFLNYTDHLRDMVRVLTENAWKGLLIVFFVIALFISPVMAFFISLGLPVAVMGAIWTMSFTGVTINIFSMFGFLLVLGVLVDDAIIVVENIDRRMAGGEPKFVAASHGASEVGAVVAFGILTNIAAFLPVIWLKGILSTTLPCIAIVAIPAMLFSLIESQLILPSHLASVRQEIYQLKIFSKIQGVFNKFFVLFVKRVYSPSLEFILRVRYVFFAAFVSTFLVALVLVAGNWVKTIFMPQLSSEQFILNVELGGSASFEQSQDLLTRIDEAARKVQKEFVDESGRSCVKNIITSVGIQPMRVGESLVRPIKKAENLGQCVLELELEVMKNIPAGKLERRWRELIGEIPNVDEFIIITDNLSSPYPLEVRVSSEDQRASNAIIDELKNAIEGFPGVDNINDNIRQGKAELLIKLKPGSEKLGINLANISSAVRHGFYGIEALRILRDGKDVPVILRFPKNERETLQTFDKMSVRSASGKFVPFNSIASLRQKVSSANIERHNKKRVSILRAGIDPEQKNMLNQVAVSLQDDIFPQIKQKYPHAKLEIIGDYENFNFVTQQLRDGFIIVAAIIYCLLAIALKSYIQPLIIMSVVPFSCIGAIFGHIIMGKDLSIASLAGILTLCGVVINDSLILVSFVNQETKKGAKAWEAAKIAGAKRFRAVVLTTITTIAGVVPLILDKEFHAQFLSPMAISLAFGIVFSTMITLYLIPCLYLFIHDIEVICKKHLHLFTRRKIEAEIL